MSGPGDRARARCAIPSRIAATSNPANGADICAANAASCSSANGPGTPRCSQQRAPAVKEHPLEHAARPSVPVQDKEELGHTVVGERAEETVSLRSGNAPVGECDGDRPGDLQRGAVAAARDRDGHQVCNPAHGELAGGRGGDGRARGERRAQGHRLGEGERRHRMLPGAEARGELWLCLPADLMAVRPMRNAAAVTFGPETAMVPVTACVRPTVSLLIPRAVSWTRKPATEPAATSHVPARGPAGPLAPAAGSTSGETAGWSLTNAPTRRTASPTKHPEAGENPPPPVTLARGPARHVTGQRLQPSFSDHFVSSSVGIGYCACVRCGCAVRGGGMGTTRKAG